MPIISVVIPTYNRSAILERTLRSFIVQESKEFEVIVVDDGGSDNTESMINSLNDNRISYYWKENAERGAARNFGAKCSKGTWLNFFDSDDIAYPNHIKEGLKVIKNDIASDMFCFGQEIRTVDGVLLSKTLPSNLSGNERMLKGNFVNPNSVFLKKSIWKELSYNEDRSVAVSEDWLFHLQLIARNKLVTYDEIITNYLIQHDNRSMALATGDSTLKRVKMLINYLVLDEVFMTKYGNKLGGIQAEVFSLSALNYALEDKRIDAIKLLIKSLFFRPSLLFTRRFIAIIKNIIL